MIIAKLSVGKGKSIKGESVIGPMFHASDEDKDGFLNLSEFKVFSQKLKSYLEGKYGKAYSLTA